VLYFTRLLVTLLANAGVLQQYPVLLIIKNPFTVYQILDQPWILVFQSIHQLKTGSLDKLKIIWQIKFINNSVLRSVGEPVFILRSLCTFPMQMLKKHNFLNFQH